MFNKILNILRFNSKRPQVNSWGYYINGPVVEKIYNSEYDLIVTDTDDSNGEPFSKSDVDHMKESPSGKRKLIIAYISLGEAEDYRWYWNNNWKKNQPKWLGKSNPDWPGNYTIKDWWHPDWQDITKAILDRVLSAGFDGIYIDKVDAYQDLGGSEELKFLMSKYIISVSEYVKNKNPNFLVIPQNAEEMAEIPEYLAAVDGIGKENTFYENDGTKVSKEDSQYAIENLNRFTKENKLVLMVEYVGGTKKRAVERNIKELDLKYVTYYGPVALNKLV